MFSSKEENITILIVPSCSTGVLCCKHTHYTIKSSLRGKKVHVFLLVMKGCAIVEYRTGRAKHKGIITMCSQLLLEGETFFSSSLLNVVLQLALVPGGSGLNVNEVLRINDLGSCIQVQEGVFRITLNWILLFYGV